MARLLTTGFELQSTTGGTDGFQIISGSINTSVFRSGAASNRLNPTATVLATEGSITPTAVNGPLFVRCAIYVATAPAATQGIMQFYDGGGKGGSQKIGIRITPTSTLQLYNFEDSAQIGSDSAALTANTWYVVTWKQDTTTLASTACEAFLNGVSFASGTANLTTTQKNLRIGNTSSATMDVYYDDIAVNDASGSFETSYPDWQGKIICLKPDSAGDANAWTRGGSDSGANWSQVDEVTPNDITDYNQSTTLNQEDFFNCDASGISSTDIVNVVTVNTRYRSDVSTNVPTFVSEIKKASGGTVTAGTATTPSSTTWRSNTTSAPYTPHITQYQDPDGASWTQAKLDTMQLGYKITVDNTNIVQISKIWAYVDYTPYTPPPSTIDALIGCGIIPF
jgi:hypothetical protein